MLFKIAYDKAVHALFGKKEKKRKAACSIIELLFHSYNCCLDIIL